MALSIQALNPQVHQVTDFDCGQPTLNSWLQTMAVQHRKRHISSTFVYTDELFPQVIIGYYALTVSEISKADLPELLKKMPQPVPVIKLGRLAIDLQFQGQGHGKDILADALLRAGSQVAGVGLVVDALNPDVAVFYRKLVFFNFNPTP